MVIRMFGFMKGKIDIKLSKYNYAPGETIEGNIMMKLKKPLQGRELNISIIAEEKRTNHAGGRRTTRIEKIYEFKQPISGEKEYTTTSMYPFKIKVPTDVKRAEDMLGKTAGKFLKAAKFMFGSRSRIKWYLIARLDVKGFDITKKVQINIC